MINVSICFLTLLIKQHAQPNTAWLGSPQSKVSRTRSPALPAPRYLHLRCLGSRGIFRVLVSFSHSGPGGLVSDITV